MHYQTLASITKRWIQKRQTKTIYSKYQDQLWMKNLELPDGAYSISSSRSVRLGHAKTKNSNHVGPRSIKNSSFWMGPALYQIFKSNLIMSSRNIKRWKTNPKYEYSSNRITFKINTEHYLELSTLQTIKVLAISEKKLNKDKSCENVPWLKPP